jgi:trehalose/maltose hydrolase-like predicted phosphorylase
MDFGHGILSVKYRVSGSAEAEVVVTTVAPRGVPALMMLVETTQPVPGLQVCSHKTVNPDVDWKPITGAPAGTVAFEGLTIEAETAESGRQSVATVATVMPVDAPPLRYWVVQTVASTAAEAITAWKQIQGREESVIEASNASWDALWQRSIRSDNVRLDEALVSSQYQIFANLGAEGFDDSVSPGGIATNAYNGHTFWDAESWVLPPLLLLQPSMAASMLRYRSNRLSAAFSKAAGLGFKGALFPWESAHVGVEVCPAAALEGTFEHHVAGDVVFAFSQFLLAQGGPSDHYDEVLKGVADFWVSRGHISERGFEIFQVMTPDESAGVVNNSLWTNLIANRSVSLAVTAARRANAPVPTFWLQFLNAGPYLPYSRELGVYLEYEGYNGSFINQDDVCLYAYPLGETVVMGGVEQLRRDLAYWVPKTRKNGYFTGDSAYGIAYLKIGNLSASDQLLWNASFAHMKLPFYTWNEKIEGGHPQFITGAGGFLQHVLYGYVGLSLEETRLVVAPSPLASVNVLSVNFEWRKQLIGLQVVAGTKIILSNRGDSTFVVQQANATTPMSPGETLSFAAPIYIFERVN